MRQPTPDAASVRLAVLLGLLLAPAAQAVPGPVAAPAGVAAEEAVAQEADAGEGVVIGEDVPKGAAEGLDEPGSPAWVSRVENVSYSYAQVLRVDPVAEDVAWTERVRQCPGDAVEVEPAPAPEAAGPAPARPAPEPPREGRIASLFGSLVDGLMGRDAVVVLEEPAPAEAPPAAEPVAVAPVESAGPVPAEGFATVDAPAGAAAAEPVASDADPDAADAPDADGCVWVEVEQVETKVVAYDVEYRYRGDIYVSRMRHDPGARLRIRVAVSPADEPR
jgi:uncharacterized protein YcfJ